MGARYYASVVVGVVLKDLEPKTDTRINTVTKYDVDTGVPYQVDITQHYITLGNTEFEGSLRTLLSNLVEENGISGNPYAYTHSGITDVYDNNLLHEVVIGFGVPIAHSINEIRVIAVDAVDELKDKMRQWLKDRLDFECEIQVYSILRCSY